jgi:hypothetical protein
VIQALQSEIWPLQSPSLKKFTKCSGQLTLDLVIERQISRISPLFALFQYSELHISFSVKSFGSCGIGSPLVKHSESFHFISFLSFLKFLFNIIFLSLCKIKSLRKVLHSQDIRSSIVLLLFPFIYLIFLWIFNIFLFCSRLCIDFFFYGFHISRQSLQPFTLHIARWNYFCELTCSHGREVRL